MTKFPSICTYSNTTHRPVQSILTQLRISMSLDWDHSKDWKDKNKQAMLAEDQDFCKLILVSWLTPMKSIKTSMK